MAGEELRSGGWCESDGSTAGASPYGGGPRGQIWLGDVARAVAALGVDAADLATVSRIANLLGMEISGSAPSPGASGRRDPAPPPEPDPPSRDAQDDASPTVETPEPPSPQPNVPVLEPVAARGGTPRNWREPALAAAGQSVAAQRPALQTLLPPHSEAATLRLLVSRLVAEGPVDVDRLLDLICTATPVPELPRRPVRTLRFGVQILVDLGEGMEPFLRDAMHVVDRVRAISGRHGTDVRYFADCPLDRCGPGAAWTWEPYRSPAAGTRALVLSDFGRRLEATGRLPAHYAGNWRRTADLVRHNGCSPVALVPVPTERWPRWLTGVMPSLCWDRTTTAAAALSALP